jgi:hypothetical protein
MIQIQIQEKRNVFGRQGVILTQTLHPTMLYKKKTRVDQGQYINKSMPRNPIRPSIHSIRQFTLHQTNVDCCVASDRTA